MLLTAGTCVSLWGPGPAQLSNSDQWEERGECPSCLAPHVRFAEKWPTSRPVLLQSRGSPSGLVTVLVNQVLLGNICAHSLTYHLWRLSELSGCDRDAMALADHLHKGVLSPEERGRPVTNLTCSLHGLLFLSGSLSVLCVTPFRVGDLLSHLHLKACS